MYQSYYNLTGKPFRLSPDPAFFFPSRGHKRALAYLRYGLHQNEGFVVITGAPGTGKTTLAQILLDEMGEKNVVVAHLTTTQLEADDMLRMVAASFGLRYEHLDKAALLKTIESFLLARSREGKRALLVIDEAQNLPARSLEELRMLSNLQVGDKAMLQTFLLGQVQFRNMLDNPDLEQLRQRVIANFHLSPLAADESQRYIEARLYQVGWNNDPQFAEIAFEKIHQYTEGVPRRINMLCDRIMLFGCMEEQHNITGEVVDLVRKELEQEVSGDSAAEHTEEAEHTAANEPMAANESTGVDKSSEPARAKAPAARQGKPATAAVPQTGAINSNRVSGATSDTEREAENKAQHHRAEPNMPILDPEEEDFIEITEDFIAAFDKSISISDDENEEADFVFPATARPSFKNPTAVKKTSTGAESKAESKTESKLNTRSEKASSDDNAKGSDERKNKPEIARQDEDRHTEDDVLGNTVKHKKFAAAESHSDDDDDDVHVVEDDNLLTDGAAAQISERDLFRVIPGGKGNDRQQSSTVDKPKSPMAPAAHASPSNEDVVLRRILRLVLAFHRSPSSFPGLDDPIQPLPEGVSELLELAVSDDEVLTKVSPAAVMGISPVMLRAAVRFFVRRTLFAAKGDHYRILGLQSNASVANIERHYDLLMRLLRQDKQPGAAECVDKVGRAYEALMRIDDVPVVATPDRHSDESESKTTAVLEALENPELTIDFKDDIKPPARPQPLSAFLGSGTDQYTPDPRITRRRIHLLGQAAILGIGALVIVLGIFITQLEPADNGERKATGTMAQAPADDEGTTAQDSNDGDQERRRGLSFNDGSAEAAVETQAEMAKVDEEPASSRRDARIASPVDRSDDKPVKIASAPTTKSVLHEVKPVPVHKKSTPVRSSSEPAERQRETPKRVSVVSAQQDTGRDMDTDNAGKEQIKIVPVIPKAQAASSSASQVPASAAEVSGSRFAPVPVKQKSASQTTDSTVSITTPASTVGANDTSTAGNVSQAGSAQNRFEGKDIPIIARTQDAPVTTGDAALAISKPELNQLLENYASAFEKGDLNGLMTLFESTARTNTQTTKQGIESEFRNMFSSSASRNITLLPTVWDSEGQFARGVGRFIQTVVPQGGAPDTVKGNFTMQARMENGQVKISRFYFSNEVAIKGTSTPSNSPGTAELKSLLTSFTKYYEKGDINNLMNLFANNAQTNDQTTLSGIRKDHMDLFNSTQVRQMFLKDIQWDVQGNTASGKGSFEVMVQPKGQDAFASVTGTIKVEAVKTADGVKITKFFHKEQ